ncbi:hypothetical protein EJB05_26672, partial [Eragrostis curvula]
MGAWPSKATAARSSPPPPWSALTPKLLHVVLRRLSSDADRLRFATVCRHWRHVANQFRSGWSALPPAIAERVLRFLPAPADRVHFASVCRRWRRIARQFSSPWPDLQPELAFLVLRRLTRSYAERVRFAAVCRHWRDVARQYSPLLPPALPWLCFNSGICESLPDGKTHILRSKEHESCCGSFGNWLLFKEINGDNCSLKNPLTGDTLSLPTHCKQPLQMSMDGRVQMPSKKKSTHFDIKKVIVCAGDFIVALVSYEYNSSREVVCCRPGMSSWSMGLCYGYQSFQDMAVHMGKVYTVENGGDLFLHKVTEDSDTREPKISRIERVMRAPVKLDRSSRCYLVNSITGRLLLVLWFLPYCNSLEDRGKGLKLKVFEADFEMCLWVEVEKLDDQVLFVSSNCSKAMRASTDDIYLQANKIYVIDCNIMSWHFWPKHDTATCMYDMCSKVVLPISLGERMFGRSKAAWFFH